MRKLLAPLLVALVAGLSVWLFQGQPVKGPVVTPQTHGVPDAFMENFSMLVLDKQGRPQYQLRAAHMAHYADDNRSEFRQPQFTVYRAGIQRWTAASETGLAKNGDEEIFLNGAVTIQQFTDAATLASMQIQTRDVRIRPADNYAETDQLATILLEDGRLSSLGMQVHFRKGLVQLVSQVRGVYAP